MKTIWKYDFPLGASVSQFSIEMPEGAQVLTAQLQGKFIVTCVLWAVVDDEMAPTERKFVAYWTGTPMQESVLEYHKYINTVIAPSGLVYHLFEVIKADTVNPL